MAMASAGVVVPAAEAEAEALAEERPHRVVEEGDEVVEGDDRSRRAAGAGRRGTAPAGCGGRAAASAPASWRRSKPHGPAVPSAPGDEAAAVRRLERVVVGDGRRGPGVAVGGADGGVDDVEQLVDRDRRREHLVGAGVAAGVGDDEGVAGGEHGVEQELAVLGPAVVVAEVAPAEEQVVAVGRAAAGEGAVVEADEAHHPVGHRAHRDERAHGEVAGAERGPGRLALAGGRRGGRGSRPGGGAGRRWRRPRPAPRRGGGRAGPAARRRCGRGVEEEVGGGVDGGRPLGGGAGVGEVADGVAEAADQLGEAAGEVDVAGVDVVEREDAADEALVVLGHGHAEEEALQAGVPGAGVDGGEVVGGAVGGVETPAGAGGLDPGGEALEVVVVEAEAAAHRGERGEAQHLGGGEAGVDEGEELGDGAEHRVGLAQRAVGEAVGDGALAVGVVEGGPQERGELVDVGAEHDDVAGLEGGVVGEEVGDGVAHDLGLAGPAVAGVDLDGACRRGRGAGGSSGSAGGASSSRMAACRRCRSVVGSAAGGGGGRRGRRASPAQAARGGRPASRGCRGPRPGAAGGGASSMVVGAPASAGDGWRARTCTSRWAASARSTSR